jgi:plastocyanin
MIRARLLILALVPAALTLSCSGDAEPPAACADPQHAETVRLEDFAFEPDCLLATSGGSIRVENVGDAPHTFTVEGTDVSLDVAAGETAEGSLSGVDPGRYAVTCVYHPQMTATLEVEA